MSRNVRPDHTFRDSCGFSAIELLMTMGIMGVLLGMAVFQIGQTVPGYKGDGGMRVVLAQVNMARELAIAQRRNMKLSFTNGNQVQIIREDIPVPPATIIPTTMVSEAFMEGGVVFRLDPLVTTDTPDGLGISSATDFGTATTVKFSPEGTLLNLSGSTVASGTVYVEIPNQPRSLRAVTIFGSTGRIRAYRWDGGNWRLV